LELALSYLKTGETAVKTKLWQNEGNRSKKDRENDNKKHWY